MSCVHSQALQVKLKIYLWELALFINEGDDIHRLECDDFQCLVVISEVNVPPGNVLCKVFFLLQLEDVVHEELLKVLVGNVNAELLKAGEGQSGNLWSALSLGQSCTALWYLSILCIKYISRYATAIVYSVNEQHTACCQS